MIFNKPSFFVINKFIFGKKTEILVSNLNAQYCALSAE